MTQVIGPWTVRRLLEWTSGFFARKDVDSPRLAAELLLAHVLGVPRLKLYTDYERPLAEKELTTYRALVQRAGEHEPIAYLTGRAHFFNLEFHVTPAVLIPRPDTETLVENVLQLSRNTAGFESPRVLDLCTGSGCIAAAIAQHLKSATVIATDLSADAVAVARANIERLGLSDRVTVEQGDLFEPIAKLPDPQPFNLIVANPPYIPTGEIEKLDRNVRDYEPVAALDGGMDGLVIHRRIFEGAVERLLPGGRIYVEIQFDQGQTVREIAESHAEFEDVRLLKDHAGHQRVLTALRK
ncbi:MAG: release factor glutamine methyltransferase [Phycisphaerales bacterium]|jgi:release factor glutamine methyltransferase|nr:release factor glutamine methyltransferase [Phycisphaerales bacterium]